VNHAYFRIGASDQSAQKVAMMDGRVSRTSTYPTKAKQMILCGKN